MDAMPPKQLLTSFGIEKPTEFNGFAEWFVFV
jgi:hypothetical protein